MKPPFRKLRAYAFDPSLSLRTDTVAINSMVYKVEWETLQPGPVGEYVEVVDYDPSIGRFYKPVDLDNPYVLAQDGLNPSESSPEFHQQMVYAVAMTTIRNFEKALGRKVLWSTRRLGAGDRNVDFDTDAESDRREDDHRPFEEYVPRLRIYPHALRDANAYYSPQKKALLFGYFSSDPTLGVVQMPSALVCTCLSHDIIAHEVTHAILDGMHYHYNEATNPDVLAFHEAFADIVALFQHFTFPEVLRHQIARTRGDLARQNLLGQLAQEFGTAIGLYGSLRDAIGKMDAEGNWKPAEPNPDDMRTRLEPHGRGSILVAAVFEAFLTIYRNRVADLIRIATGGSGIQFEGELHPDLVNRMADEAARTASHVLGICIRALDYCAPVDITFGDYLRAIITADSDLVADDSLHYRLAFIDAFRRRGIFPTGIRTLSEESLRHPCCPSLGPQAQSLVEIIAEFLRGFRNEVMYLTERKQISDVARSFIRGRRGREGLHRRISFKFEENAEFERLTGLVFNTRWRDFGVRTSRAYKGTEGPSFAVQNLRLVNRIGPSGSQINQIIFSLVQRCGVIVREGKIAGGFVPGETQKPPGGFEFRGGCTMIFDLDSLELKSCIAKPILRFDPNNSKYGIVDKERALRQHHYQTEEGLLAMGEYARYFGFGLTGEQIEPFALLHQH